MSESRTGFDILASHRAVIAPRGILDRNPLTRDVHPVGSALAINDISLYSQDDLFIDFQTDRTRRTSATPTPTRPTTRTSR